MSDLENLRQQKAIVDGLMARPEYQMDAPGGPVRSKLDPIAQQVYAEYDEAEAYHKKHVDEVVAKGMLPVPTKRDAAMAGLSAVTSLPSEVGDYLAETIHPELRTGPAQIQDGSGGIDPRKSRDLAKRTGAPMPPIMERRSAQTPELIDSALKTGVSLARWTPPGMIADALGHGINKASQAITGDATSHPMTTVDEYLGNNDEARARSLMTLPIGVLLSGGAAGAAGLPGRIPQAVANNPLVKGGAAITDATLGRLAKPIQGAANSLFPNSPAIAGLAGGAGIGAATTVADRALRGELPTPGDVGLGMFLPGLMGLTGGLGASAVNPNTKGGKRTADMVATEEQAKAIPEDFSTLSDKYLGTSNPLDSSTPSDRSGRINEVKAVAKQKRGEIVDEATRQAAENAQGLAKRFQKKVNEELQAEQDLHGAVFDSIMSDPKARVPIDMSALDKALSSHVKIGDVSGNAINQRLSDLTDAIRTKLFRYGATPSVDPVTNTPRPMQASWRDLYLVYKDVKRISETGTPEDRAAATQVIQDLKKSMFEYDPTGKAQPQQERFKREAGRLERLPGIVYGEEDKAAANAPPPAKERRAAKFFFDAGGDKENSMLTSEQLKEVETGGKPGGDPEYGDIVRSAREARQRVAEAGDPEKLLRESKAAAERGDFKEAERLYQEYEAQPENVAGQEEQVMRDQLKAKGLQELFTMHPPEPGYVLNEAFGSRTNSYIPHKFVGNALRVARGGFAKRAPLPQPGKGPGSDALSQMLPQFAAMQVSGGPMALHVVNKEVKRRAEEYAKMLSDRYDALKEKLKSVTGREEQKALLDEMRKIEQHFEEQPPGEQR